MALHARSTGYGVVKAVLSGDSIVVIGGANPGQIPPERVVVFTGITAPRFARSKNAEDEPYAYEARELIRKKVIGKQVSFVVSSTSETGRVYANVFLGSENLSHTLVRNGLARIKSNPNESKSSRMTPEREELEKMVDEARSNQLGFFSKDESDHIRDIEWNPVVKSLYKRAKGQAVNAVVSQVRDGSTLRCELKHGAQTWIITFLLAGALSPRVPISHEYLMAQYEKKKADDSDFDEEEPKKEDTAPFANEAVNFVERRLLHRDVKLHILGMDKYNNLYGDVIVPEGNITKRLLETGLSKFVPWSACITNKSTELEAAETAAVSKKLCLWQNEKKERKESKTFQAKVVFIFSGDTIIVKDGDDVERRICLSSVRAPRLGNSRRGEKDAPFANDAKEYLRKKLIGKKVKVVVDYVRSVPPRNEAREYCTVYAGNMNVSADLLKEGLATTLNHRPEDPRSPDYFKLCEAEEFAESKKAGLHNKNSKAGKSSVIDLTRAPVGVKKEKGNEDTNDKLQGRARTFLPFLQREKFFDAVVEYVFSGSRMKVYVPKENIMIAFALVGVRTPGTKEPLGEEAANLVKSQILQHNVRISVETIDKGDNFIGTMVFNGVNIGIDLLQKGLAQVQPYGAERSPYKEDLYQAQAGAKEAKLKVWENYVEEVIVDDDNSESAAEGLNSNEMEVVVTEIVDSCNFYINVVNDKNLEKINDAMSNFNADSAEQLETPTGIMAGKHTDGLWYRVKVESRVNAEKEVDVFFIDFGNHDTLLVSDLRALPESVANIKPLARVCVLAACKSPSTTSEYFESAGEAFSEFAFNRNLKCKIECIDKKGKLNVSLFDKELDENLSINQVMVREGYVRVAERPDWKLKDLAKSLREDEKLAKGSRINIWEYGDVSDDEEEEETRPRNDGRPPRR